jgi:hypothetical protein
VRTTLARPVIGRYVLVHQAATGPGGTYKADVHRIGVKARS